ncbi:protein SPT2 homolog [Nilaparvata lugens]|uniref:protein SPT2 homolog n=1 Tax=Nilaparvata lugens TaxID=108931 RepID=UPI00193EB2A3|nr:protein SPT2 homolog [Nilaparvata lugens]
MDFGNLLYAAQNNTEHKSRETRCYKTTFEPPKKEVKPKQLSANVQKFLQKQEEEKRRKEIEAKKKREELLALRSQDKMSQKRMSTMLKRTKSANKSVMEDAIDDVNTSVTMAGPQQCDEDDYGYVSQEASSFYNKMMEKYTSMPSDEPSFLKPKKGTAKDLSAAKERVKAALNRVEEEEMLPRKRKRKTKESEGDKEEDDFIDDSGNYRKGDDDREKEKEKEKPKKPKRPPMPPPMDFQALLKLAEQKQHEPVVIDKKRKRDSSSDEDEDDEDEERKKLMTKKQRLEYEREKEARMQRERRRMEEAMRNRNGGGKPGEKVRPRERERSQEREPKSRERESKDKEQRSRSPPRSSATLKGGGGFKIPKNPDASRTESASRKENGSRTESASRTDSASKKENASRTESASRIPKTSESSSTPSKPRSLETSRSSESSSKPSKSVESSRPSKSVESSRSSSESSSAPRIPKLSDKTNKPAVLDNKKRLPSSVVEEKLKKSSDVWSKPCNLSPSSKKLQQSRTSSSSNSNSRGGGGGGSTTKPLEDKLNKLMDEIRSVKQASTKLDLEDKLEMLSRELEQIKKERSRVESSGKGGERGSNGSLDRRKEGEDRKRRDENCEKQKYIPTKISRDGGKSDVPKTSSSTSSKQKVDSSTPKVNGYKPTPISKLNAGKPSKLKSVDLFGEDFPEDSPDPRKSNGDYNKPSMAAAKQTLSKPSLAKAAEMAGKQRDLKSATASPAQKPTLNKGTTSNVSSKSAASGGSVAVRKFPPDDLKPRPGDRMRPAGTGGPVRSRQFPPPDVQRSRQFPPNDVRRRRPSPPRSSRYYADEDDEDEYDSEMDDFIDYGDGDDEDNEHVSEIISEIFKYNPSQFSIGDDDDECMESNFGQIDKEEIRSLHIGLREDLEDIRREQAEKKEAQRRRLQKMAAMKKNRR